MMVHFENAIVALAAMVCTSRLPGLLAIAFLAILYLIILTLKGCLKTFRNTSRVCKGRPKMADNCSDTQSIKCDEVKETLHCQRDPLDELLVDQSFFMPVEYVGTIANVLSINDQCNGKMGKDHAPDVHCPVHIIIISL